jgi:hypothetical protein
MLNKINQIKIKANKQPKLKNLNKKRKTHQKFNKLKLLNKINQIKIKANKQPKLKNLNKQLLK